MIFRRVCNFVTEDRFNEADRRLSDLDGKAQGEQSPDEEKRFKKTRIFLKKSRKIAKNRRLFRVIFRILRYHGKTLTVYLIKHYDS